MAHVSLEADPRPILEKTIIRPWLFRKYSCFATLQKHYEHWYRVLKHYKPTCEKHLKIQIVNSEYVLTPNNPIRSFEFSELKKNQCHPSLIRRAQDTLPPAQGAAAKPRRTRHFGGAIRKTTKNDYIMRPSSSLLRSVWDGKTEAYSRSNGKTARRSNLLLIHEKSFDKTMCH